MVRRNFLMIARGFKPVGWVAAIATSVLGCYMLSLNVAAERADLASVERQIIAAKQDIRTLQTELGTRGRLTQLEHWNAEVLALSAPASKQFLQNEFRLASFTEPPRSLDENVVKVRMASADAVTAPPTAKPAIVSDFVNETTSPPVLVRKASLAVADAPAQGESPVVSKSMDKKPTPAKSALAKPAPVRKASLIGNDLIREIGAASKAENRNGDSSAQ
jgi:hypothetical protein